MRRFVGNNSPVCRDGRESLTDALDFERYLRHGAFLSGRPRGTGTAWAASSSVNVESRRRRPSSFLIRDPAAPNGAPNVCEMSSSPGAHGTGLLPAALWAEGAPLGA